jgi:hypothetical protein
VSDDPKGPCQLCIQDGPVAKASCVLLSAEERRVKRGGFLCVTSLIVVKRSEISEPGLAARTKEGEAAANSLLTLSQPANTSPQSMRKSAIR